MSRILIAGFQHETNTFAPVKAQYEYFERGEGWPGLTRGPAMFEVLPPMNISSGGFIKEAQRLGHSLLPVLWAAAVPSSYVTEDAYERIAGDIIKGIKAHAGEFDAIYLDLHGAMVAEHHQDGEGELLSRVRAVVGPDMPIAVSLDLHANVTEAMVQHATLLCAYRTYPHVDMAATGARTARMLDQILTGKRPVPAKAFRRVPFLLPLTFQCTMAEPSKGIYDSFGGLERDGVLLVNYTPGFPPADIRECGPTVFCYGDTQEAADAAADTLLKSIVDKEEAFAVGLMTPQAAVAHAMRMSNQARKPIVLADVQDNPGAGGTGDTTGLLAALVAADARGAAIGVLYDPEAAKAAHAAGVGAEIEIEVGGKVFRDGDPPFRGKFTVEALGDGRFLCTGPFYGGTRANLGPTACLRIGDVRVVVSSGRMQAADKEMFRHVGVEPEQVKILGLKSTVHFRADFAPIAEEILVVEAPGAFVDRPANLPYKNLRAGVRLGPFGPEHRGA